MQLKFLKKSKIHFWTGPTGIGTCTNVAQLGRLNFQISEISVIASYRFIQDCCALSLGRRSPCYIEYSKTATTEDNKTEITRLHINKSLSE